VKANAMKALYIIESETPGITRSRIGVDQITKHFTGGLEIDIGDFSSLEIEKRKGYFRGNKILRIYRSGHKSNEYFVRHFM
jgi:hypothetical protein